MNCFNNYYLFGMLVFFLVVFFNDLFTHFFNFRSQIEVMVMVTPKQEVERKSEWICLVNFFTPNLKQE